MATNTILLLQERHCVNKTTKLDANFDSHTLMLFFVRKRLHLKLRLIKIYEYCTVCFVLSAALVLYVHADCIWMDTNICLHTYIYEFSFVLS